MDNNKEQIVNDLPSEIENNPDVSKESNMEAPVISQKPKRETSWLVLIFLLIAIIVLVLAYLIPKIKSTNTYTPLEDSSINESLENDNEDEDENENNQEVEEEEDDDDEDDKGDGSLTILDSNNNLIGKVTFSKDGGLFYDKNGNLLYDDDQEYKNYFYIAGDYIGGTINKCHLTEEDREVCEVKYLDILSSSEKKLIKRIEINQVYGDISAEKKGNFIIIWDNSAAPYLYAVFNAKLDLIFESGGIDYNLYSFDDKGNLYVSKDGTVITYDNNGNILNTSKKYENIKSVIKGGYIVTINDKLRLITPEGKEIVLTEWNKEMHFHEMISGWYTQDGKNGIYLVVEDDSASEDEVWNYCKNHLNECNIEGKKDLKNADKGYEYYYIPETGETGKIPATIGGYAKPVLYLYPTKKTNVTVTFLKPENLTTTYPKYKNSWSVTAYPNGDLYDKDNKYYYALYWEEVKNHDITFDEGFYVNANNAIEFLESKLTILGLNPKERNEFIMYWLPILEENKHSLVYFEQTEERDKYSKINISPKPDSILRISMHVKKVDKKVYIKEEKLNTFNRTGFSAVEWGGVIH